MVELKRDVSCPGVGISADGSFQIPYDYPDPGDGYRQGCAACRLKLHLDVEIPEGEPQFEMVALFSDISVGDAP